MAQKTHRQPGRAGEVAGWIPADIEPGPHTGDRVKSVSLLVVNIEGKAEAVFDDDGHPLLDPSDLPLELNDNSNRPAEPGDLPWGLDNTRLCSPYKRLRYVRHRTVFRNRVG